MGIAAWGALDRGCFKSKNKRGERGGRAWNVKTDRGDAVADVIERVSLRLGTPMTSVAMVWLMQKIPHVFPIVGGRKVEHLRGNVESLSLELSEGDFGEVYSAYGIEVGFPYGFLGGGKMTSEPADTVFTQRCSNLRLSERAKGYQAAQGAFECSWPPSGVKDR